MSDHQVYAALAVLLVIIIVLMIAMRAHRRLDTFEQRNAALATALEELRADLASVAQNMVELAGREAARDRRIQALGEQQETLRLHEDTPARSDEAIRLARGGASVEEIVQTCGLNRGEAELVVALHGRPAHQQAHRTGPANDQD